MRINFDVRPAEPADAPRMARVHVDTSRETYRGLMNDATLDDPALLSWREQFWHGALTYPKYSHNTIGSALLHAVIDRNETAALWVGDPNPRAPAFYRKTDSSPMGQ
jgi:GNAT superfamily N-acetyltransferase